MAKRNPIAKQVAEDPYFRTRIKPDPRKTYKRKPKHPKKDEKYAY